MKKNILRVFLEEDKGFTIFEILISMFIFTIICFSAILILRSSLSTLREKNIEKEILKEIVNISEFIENRISLAMINNLDGKYRMNFKGEENWVKFIAPFSEGDQGDIAKFGIYWKDDKILVHMTRVDRENPDFTFFEGFPGAQILANNIKNFTIRYFDGKDWKKNWNTEIMEEPELPEYIEYEIVICKGKVEGREIEKIFKNRVKIGS